MIVIVVEPVNQSAGDKTDGTKNDNGWGVDFANKEASTETETKTRKILFWKEDIKCRGGRGKWKAQYVDEVITQLEQKKDDLRLRH